MEEMWNIYEWQRPPDVLCIFRHGDSKETFTAKPSQFPPEFNIAGLQWRLTGIGRQYLDSLPQDVRLQIEPPPWASLSGLLGYQIHSQQAWYQGWGPSFGFRP